MSHPGEGNVCQESLVLVPNMCMPVVLGFIIKLIKHYIIYQISLLSSNIEKSQERRGHTVRNVWNKDLLTET